MALSVRIVSPSLSPSSSYFSQEPLVVRFEAYDTVTNNGVYDTNNLKHTFIVQLGFDGENLGTYYIPYVKGLTPAELDIQPLVKAWPFIISDVISGNYYNYGTDLLKEITFTLRCEQLNLTTKAKTLTSTITEDPLCGVVLGGQDFYDRPYTSLNLNNDLDTRGYIIDDPADTNKKFLTQKPQGACRADFSQATMLVYGSVNPVDTSTWFPENWYTEDPWQSEFSLEAPETQSAAWVFNDGNSNWELPDNATWGTGEQTQILTWYPGVGVKNALYAGDSGSITVSGQFATAALGLSEIYWDMVGIIDIDSPWEYDVLDTNYYDLSVVSLPVTQMSFDFDVASDYQAIGFMARSPGIGPFSQGDSLYFEVMDFQVLWRDAYWLKTSYIGFNYYTPITARGPLGFYMGEDMGITPGVDYCIQVVNNNFEPLSEQYCNNTCCDTLRKYEKADIKFLGQLGSFEGARFYMATGVKTTVNDPISNVRYYVMQHNYTRNLRQLGDYTTRSYTLISDYVTSAEVEWLQTIASSTDVQLKLNGVYRPVIVTSMESEMHLYDRDLYQFSITVQDANYNIR